MSWILGGIYCGVLWLVFAKLKLLRLSLPLAIVLASVGPGLIITLLFCAQYFHPFTARARVFQHVVPIAPQLSQPGRVLKVAVTPNQSLSAGDILFEVDPVPYQNACERLRAQLEQARQAREVAETSIQLAQAAVDRAQANLKFATTEKERVDEIRRINPAAASEAQVDAAINRVADANASVRQSNANLTQSRLSVETADARIDELETQLSDSEYDLKQTTVRAPGDGFVTNLQLQPGMLIGGAGNTAVMSFVLERSEHNLGMVVASFGQKNYLRIKAGNYAEIALHAYPGQIFTGRVVNTIDVSGAGQLMASGDLPSQLIDGSSTNFAVRIKLDDADELRLPAGSQAMAAVYTEDVQIAGIPIMFLIRAKSWMNFLF